MEIRNIAIILASGVGLRFGTDTPKQFLKVAGKTVLEHTIDIFEFHPQIHEIILVTSNDFRILTEEIITRSQYTKVTKILTGGVTRQESTCIAIQSIHGDHHNVLVHDAVRPLLSGDIISNCLKGLEVESCVDTIIPASDTIVYSEDGYYIKNIPNRANYYLGQTPQGFKSGLLRKAHGYVEDNSSVTDDCGLVLKYKLAPIKLIQGAVSNIKITYPSDIYMADRLFQLKSIKNLDQVDYSILEQKVIVIFGGSQGIGASIRNIAKKYCASVYVASKSCGVDITNINDVREFLKKVFKKNGRIDIVINTAGLLKTGKLIAQDYVSIQEQINTNLLGSIIVAKESFEFMKEKGGKIILFSSSSYTRGRALSTVYSASKAAVVNLMQGLAQEFLSSNVQINCINPERTSTEMRRSNFGYESPDILLSPDRVALVTLSTLLSNINGEVIDVRL